MQPYPPYDTLAECTVNPMAEALRLLGVHDPDNEHTALTPHRLVYYLEWLRSGAEDFNLTTFPNSSPDTSHMDVVPKIPFWSACSHHCLPFFGHISVGYIPDKCVIGLSKIPKLVRLKARGFWLQEDLAAEIADHLEEALSPHGVGVHIRARHTCQLLDLRQPPIPEMVTTVLRGELHPWEGTGREEFLRAIYD